MLISKNKTRDCYNLLNIKFHKNLHSYVKIEHSFIFMFIKFQKNQIKAIEETKVAKKSKCGIIPFVHSFEVNPLWSINKIIQ